MAIIIVTPGALAAAAPGPGPGPNPAFDRTVTVASLGGSPPRYGMQKIPGFPGSDIGDISDPVIGSNRITLLGYLDNSPTINFNLRISTPSLAPAPSNAFERISLEWSGGNVEFARADADDPNGAASGIQRSWLWSIPAAEVRWTASDVGVTYDFGIV